MEGKAVRCPHDRETLYRGSSPPLCSRLEGNFGYAFEPILDRPAFRRRAARLS